MQNLKLFRPYLLDNCLNDVGPLKGNRTLFLRKVSLIFKANSENSLRVLAQRLKWGGIWLFTQTKCDSEFIKNILL